MRALRFVLVLACCVSALALAGAPKKKGKPKPKPAPVSAESLISKALDDAEAKVGACVMDAAGPGAWTRVVHVKLALNSAGQLMSSKVELSPDDAAAAKARPCIEGVLQATAFPKHDGPLANADREWTFSTEAR